MIARARLDLWLPHGWPDAQPQSALHVRFQANGGVAPIELGAVASLAELDGWLAARRRPGVSTQIVIWAPASEVLLFYPLRLPTRSARTLAQALPFALEDQLLDDPDKLHFVYTRHSEALAVAVTARARIERWLATLSEAAWPAEVLCPAVLSLPIPEEDSWSLVALGEAMLVRQGEFAGFACLGPFEPDRPPALLAAALAEARAAGAAPARLVCYDPLPAEPISLAAWSQALAVAIEHSERDFRSYAPAALLLDLRHGAYTPRGHWRAKLRPFWPAAVFSAVALLGSLVLDGVEWWRLQRTAHELAQQMHALYTSAFPQSKTVLDPYRQMRRELERLESRLAAAGHSEGASAFLVLLARTAVVLKEDPRLVLDSLHYQPQEGLVLELHAAAREAILDFTARLHRTGLAGKTQAFEPGQKGGIRARLQVHASRHDDRDRPARQGP